MFLIAPASANTIAKLASGMADNLLTSCALAAACPVLVAPAMNNRMYEHPATRENLATLRARGTQIIDPGTGRLASKGEEGVGRLAEPPDLLAACEAAIAGRERQGEIFDGDGSARGVRPRAGGTLDGVSVLVTAGGTREPIDSVRFVGNSSSGRMGFALAAQAAARGARVTLIAANVALPAPPGVRVVEVGTAAELKDAAEREFAGAEVLLMAAAVADFAPVAAEGKIKKGGRERLELVLEPTPDVLSALSKARRAGQTLVGFAAEHGAEGLEYARGKLAAKGLDAVVFNDISRAEIGFDSTENEVTILTSSNGAGTVAAEHVPQASKERVAEAILDAVERLREGVLG